MLSLEFITLFVNTFLLFTYTKLTESEDSAISWRLFPNMAPEITAMRYNERIREIREDNSMTQQRIADLLHIGQRTYADYESGKTRIPVDSLLILARFYDVSMDYITGASDIQTEYPLK